MKTLVGIVLVGMLFAALPTERAEAALTCGGKTATIVGTNGNDVINGTSGNDVIVGRQGNDVIDGKGGNDYICGDDGNDKLIGNNGDDRIWGLDGTDEIRGGNGRDRLYGGPGGDRMYGGAHDDELRGFANGDLMLGGSGSDKLYGGVGDDIADGGPDSDIAYGGDGVDACFSASTPTANTCEPSVLTTTEQTWSNTYANIYELLFSDTDWSLGEAWLAYPEVDGDSYAQGFGIVANSGVDNGDYGYYQYDLGRDYRKLTATIGVRDTSPDTDVSYRFDVIGDNSILKSYVVGFGQHKAIKVDVTNVLRLELRITVIAPGDGYLNASYNYSLFLNPRVSANTKLLVEGSLS